MSPKRKLLAIADSGTLTRVIIVAIDFGTTYTGTAWAQTARPEIQTPIVEWPDADGSFEGQTSEKVPTEICYMEDAVKWGFEIADEEDRHMWFKLGLDPSQKNQEVSLLAIDHPDPKALPPAYEDDKSAVKLTTDYLSKIQQHTKAILRIKVGDGVVDSTPIRYTITVPAIWSDAAKAQTQKCATAAGMGEEINIISEPEAAVIYALDSMDPGRLKVGDSFVLCDAGGGTVDLITYTIVELAPVVKVREAVPGSGHACGSIFLNRRLRQYITDHYSHLEGYAEDTLEEAVKEFEATTKRKFNGESENNMVRVPGLADNPALGVKRQKLTIGAQVKGQLQQARTAKAVILVGGFGQSPYLRTCIQKVVGPDIEVIRPPNGWSAVVRGALMRAIHNSSPELSRVNITSLVARKAYGLKLGTRYIPREHQGVQKYWSRYYGEDRVTEMTWVIKKGDVIDQMAPATVSLSTNRSVDHTPPKSYEMTLWFFEPTSNTLAPKHPCEGVMKLVDLKADLSAIAAADIPISTGQDGELYYFLKFEIRVAFFSAHMDFSLWYKNKQCGSVKADFT